MSLALLLLALQAPSIPLPVEQAGPARLDTLPPGAASYWRGGRFGHALAADGDRLVVGAPEFRADGFVQGRARFFERAVDGSWAATTTLALPAPPEGVEGRLGAAVDLEGDVAVVGVPAWADVGPIPGAGRVHVLERRADASWEVVQVLEPLDPVASPQVRFGRALDLDGDRLAVATQNAHGTHVYRRGADGQWSLEDRLLPPADADEGGELALEGDDLFVLGWEYAPATDTYTWGVRHWRHESSGWFDRGPLPGVGEHASHDVSLALEAGHLAVGLPWDPDLGYKAGAVELFERAPDGHFAPVATLHAAGAGTGDHFGVSTLWSGDVLFAGAPLSDLGGVDRGAVWRFERLDGHWRPTARAVGGGDPAQFGHALAASRADLLVAAPERSTEFDAVPTGEPSGAVEVWTRRPLAADPPTLPASTGGVQHLTLTAGPDAAGLPYLILGGASGPRPPLDRVGAPRLPLVVDAYTLASALGAGAPPWTGTAGTTDALGRAAAAIELSPLPTAAVGTVLHHAALVLAADGPWPLVTDAVRLVVGP